MLNLQEFILLESNINDVFDMTNPIKTVGDVYNLDFTNKFKIYYTKDGKYSISYTKIIQTDKYMKRGDSEEVQNYIRNNKTLDMNEPIESWWKRQFIFHVPGKTCFNPVHIKEFFNKKYDTSKITDDTTFSFLDFMNILMSDNVETVWDNMFQKERNPLWVIYTLTNDKKISDTDYKRKAFSIIDTGVFKNKRVVSYKGYYIVLKDK